MQTVRQAFTILKQNPLLSTISILGYGICHYHDYGYCDYLANEVCRFGTGSEP